MKIKGKRGGVCVMQLGPVTFQGSYENLERIKAATENVVVLMTGLNMSQKEIATLTDRHILRILNGINRELFKRYGTDAEEEQEHEGLETLTSACEEIDDMLRVGR